MKKNDNYILRFIKSTAIFFVGIIIPKAVVFLLLSFNTSHISTTDYGYYDLSISYMTFAVYLLFFDIWVSMMRFMYERNNIGDKDSTLKSGNRVFLLSCAIYTVIAVIVKVIYSPKYLLLIYLYGLTQNIANMYIFAARGYDRGNDYAISGLVGSIILALTNIILVNNGSDFSALYIAGILGFVAQIAFIELRVGYFRRIFRAKTSSGLTVTLLKYTLPLGVNSAAFWTLISFNKIILSTILDLDSNGVYAVAEKLAGIMTFAVLCFTYAWQDIAFDNEEIDKGIFYAGACKLYFAFLSVGMILLMPALKVVFPIIINESYSGAVLVIPFAIIATALSGYSLFMANIFQAIKEPKSVTISTLISCVVNFAICYPCIKVFGISGASIAIIISFAADAFIKGAILKKRIGFSQSPAVILGCTTAVAAGMAVYYYLSTAANILWFVICFIALSVVAFKNRDLILKH